MGLDRGGTGSFWVGSVVRLDHHLSVRMLASSPKTSPDAPVPRWVRGFLVYRYSADSRDVRQPECLSGLYLAGLSLDVGGDPLPSSRAAGGSAGARAGGC